MVVAAKPVGADRERARWSAPGCCAAGWSRPVTGRSGFAERMAAGEPRDRQGRSLYELDLKRRLMKYPCSYLIYSPAFDALPPLAKVRSHALPL
jgi:hypothetical protein